MVQRSVRRLRRHAQTATHRYTRDVLVSLAKAAHHFTIWGASRPLPREKRTRSNLAKMMAPKRGEVPRPPGAPCRAVPCRAGRVTPESSTQCAVRGADAAAGPCDARPPRQGLAGLPGPACQTDPLSPSGRGSASWRVQRGPRGQAAGPAGPQLSPRVHDDANVDVPFGLVQRA